MTTQRNSAVVLRNSTDAYVLSNPHGLVSDDDREMNSSVVTSSSSSNVTNNNKQQRVRAPMTTNSFQRTVEITTKDEVTMGLSILYGITVVILAIVLKVTENITQEKHLASKEYQCILFSIAIVWLIAFKIYTFWHQRVLGRSEFSRSPHASNRWLKGVIALFGFAIVIKDSLEVIGVLEIDNPMCKDKLLYLFKFVLHAVFVLGQVIFLFFYAKIHIHEFKICSRFGVMHAMATNLSVWIGVIADETSYAIKTDATHAYSTNHEAILTLQEYNVSKIIDEIKSYCDNSSQLSSYLNLEGAGLAPTALQTRGLFSGSCACYTPVCNVIARADKFLSPLLIEFCLVSSCLLYCIWNHVGKETLHHKDVAKPSHKFYKSYKGVMLGALVLVATIIVITLLGTLDSGTASADMSYYTEIRYLQVYEGFLLSCNIAILLACIFAFYVYSVSDIKRTNSSVGLDSVLLFICLVGPLMVGLSSILCLSAGATDAKAPSWPLSLMVSVTDIAVSLVQVQLIVYGLHRERVTDDNLLSDARNLSVRLTSNVEKNVGFDNQVNTMQGIKQCSNNEFQAGDQLPDSPLPDGSDNDSVFNAERSLPEIQVQNEQPLRVGIEPQISVVTTVCNNCSGTDRRKTLLPPNSIRLILRETIMFLVLSNSCLWLFLSLNGTIFKIYTYQSEYFGYSAWTTLVSVTAPLTIFLKLHFAACYFEIWSYS